MGTDRNSDPRSIATGMASALAEELGGALHSVLLYGSVARAEAVRGISDINVLVLVEDIDASLLKRAAPLARRWAEQGVSPLLLERAEWRAAADVFPMEVADMRDAHVTLHGEDPLQGLEVGADMLRLQAERDVRTRLVQLHNGLLVAGVEREKVGAVLAGALPAFVTYLRAALRLAGQEAPTSSRDAISAGAELVGADPTAYLHIHEERQRGRVPSLALDDRKVDGFNHTAEQTARWVDQADTDKGSES